MSAVLSRHAPARVVPGERVGPGRDGTDLPGLQAESREELFDPGCVGLGQLVVSRRPALNTQNRKTPLSERWYEQHFLAAFDLP